MNLNIDMICYIHPSYEVWQVESDFINKHLNFLNPFYTPYWFNTYYLVYLSICKAKAKQFQRQLKKMQESKENKIKIKKYLRKQNFDHLIDGVVNKTIEKKEFGKHSTKSAGDNINNFAEFINNYSEEK